MPYKPHLGPTLFTGFISIIKKDGRTAEFDSGNLSFQRWPVRLGVRTPASHAGNRGSIPLRATCLLLAFSHWPLDIENNKQNTTLNNSLMVLVMVGW